MATPRHRTAPGSSYFVTTKCWQGHSAFQVPEFARIVVRKLLHYLEKKTYSLHEFVVMPNHLHVLLTPSVNTSLEKAVQVIKGGSSYEIRKERGNKMEIWQEGFHDWTIRDAEDWRAKVEYIRLNPVRAGLVNKPEEWPYCSAALGVALDPVPPRYLQAASGAKAPTRVEGAILTPPGLKSRPPENPNPSTPATLGVESWPPENENLSAAKAAANTAGGASGLKPPPAKGQGA